MWKNGKNFGLYVQNFAAKPEHAQNWPALNSKMFTLLVLSRNFFEQLRSGTIMLYFGMQFIHIISHCDEKNLS